MRLLAARARPADDSGMQVITAPTSTSLPERLAVLRSGAVAGLLILTGLSLGWLCLGTAFVTQFSPVGRPDIGEMAVGALVWGFAIVFPGSFLVLGMARLASLLDELDTLRPQGVTPALASALGPDHLVATDLVLPGGRQLHEMVLGPFGVVVLGDVPPPAVSRQLGSHWEVRDPKGRWIPVEGPLERAARDAERVRSWLGSDDRDFVVRVYALVVSDDPRLARTPTCAVVAPRDLAEWFAALPFQRGLTPDRRGRLAELVRSVALHR